MIFYTYNPEDFTEFGNLWVPKDYQTTDLQAHVEKARAQINEAMSPAHVEETRAGLEGSGGGSSGDSYIVVATQTFQVNESAGPSQINWGGSIVWAPQAQGNGVAKCWFDQAMGAPSEEQKAKARADEAAKDRAAKRIDWGLSYPTPISDEDSAIFANALSR